MISINTNPIPLDFDISLDDFLRQLMQHHKMIRSDKLSYSYKDVLNIKEIIGTELTAETLIYYPELCRQVRKLQRLSYDVNLNLGGIENVFSKGLTSIIDSLQLIRDLLQNARCEKARLDAQINNLIYLYGQNRSIPLLRSIKPYFYNRSNAYQYTTTYTLNIAGINYYLHYRGNRFGALKMLYTITPHQILKHYFEMTKSDANAVSPCLIIKFIGGIINTPILAFRVRQSSNHRGKKYFINLATCQTYTRIADIQAASRQYTRNFNITLLKD